MKIREIRNDPWYGIFTFVIMIVTAFSLIGLVNINNDGHSNHRVQCAALAVAMQNTLDRDTPQYLYAEEIYQEEC